MLRKDPKRCFQPVPQPAFVSTALLVLQLIAGAAFVLHGWGKIQTPFSWVPAEAPVHIPSFFQFLAAFSEFGGGIAWIIGLLTPLASFGIGCTMTVAVYMHMIVNRDPFVAKGLDASYEPALVYLGIAILLMALGPGTFSLDAKVFGERK